MPNYFRFTLFSIALLFLLSEARVANAGEPDLLSLTYVSQLANDLPQRVSGFGYDGEKLWVMTYMDRGAFATLNPSTLEWTVNQDLDRQRLIAEVAGYTGSPGGI